ncbi:hypothetical protein PHYPSEUDO_008471 [Phytophthora pseudosyringae]|uniref:Tyrosine-protein kinase ephrin type A/B receptor-like domain-containing protein n=1 Tax=Phytophthora pseudosyringae TaxID=221518 RepID=A0A8T1VHE2_9STRA|nr:hypothetical protein PHYPSEUDO_008471 [Phytophthora pseudosyringae]
MGPWNASLFVVIAWATQLLVAVELLLPSNSAAAQSLAASEANCSVADEAQNASVTLSWTLFDGDVNYTRISHSSEALVAATGGSSLPDRLLILGGIEYESAQPVVDSPVLVYDVATNAFSKPLDQILSAVSAAYQPSGASVETVFTSPASRAEHASFANQDGAVFVFGGRSREFVNDTWRGCVDSSSTNIFWDELVTATDASTVAAAPAPRIGHSFTKVFENSSTIGALVFGGLSEDYVEVSGLHVAFITKASSSSSWAAACTNRGPKLTWRMLKAGPLTDTGAIPSARAYHAAMTPSKLFTPMKLACVVVHGGKSTREGVIFNELWRLCPPSVPPASVPVERVAFTWELLTEIGTTPGARYGASIAFVDEGKLALAGGSYTFPSDFLSDTWELNVNATQWIRLAFTEDFTPPRRGHSLSFFSTATRLFLFGGRDRYAVVKKRMQAAYYGAPFCATGLKITFCTATAKYVCIACPAGSYLESGSRKCLLCSQGTFSSAGSAQCTKCPAGTFSTDVGKDSSAPCTSCPSGTFSQAVGAVSSAACDACAAGTFTASPGSVSCASCAAGSFSSANASTCTACPRGKWSAAGAGTCTECAAGTYTPRGDCAVPVDETATTVAAAVLFFPDAPLKLVNASASAAATDIQVKVVRSGSLDSRVQAIVAWSLSNFSASPSSLPVMLDFAAGEHQKTVQISIMQLSPTSGCRFFNLLLKDATEATTSSVSSDSDSALTVYVDDMNGVSGRVAGRAVTSTYVRQTNGTAIAAVTLDRLVATQVTLSPQLTVAEANLGVSLRDQPLNLLVAIDFSASWVSAFIDLLPAIVAQLQIVYRAVPDGVRLGLVNGTTKPVATFYPDLVDFVAAAQALAASSAGNTPVDWDWVAAGLAAGTSSWPSTDRRHLLIVAGDTLVAGGSVTLLSTLLNQLRSQSVFAFTLSPTQVTFASGSDVLKSVPYGTLPAISSALRQAFEQKDSALPSSVNILNDPAGLASSAQATGFSSGSSSLPVIRITMGSYPTPAQLKSMPSLTVTIGVPGYCLLAIVVSEPGPACYPPAQTIPVHSLPLSGWADAWHLSTESDIKRLWKPSIDSSTLLMTLRQETSLLRKWTSTVLSVYDSASKQLSLERTYPGSFFAAGLSLVSRGYWRSASEGGTADCNIQLTMIGTNTSLTASSTVPFASHVVPGEWNYGYLQTIIPWELSSLSLTLKCNASVPGVVVEWAALGLLPEPDFACKCPRGFYHNTLSVLNDIDGTCARCAAGSYCAAGIKRQCPDGTFSFGKSASCETCRDGWICTDGLARLCDPGTYSTPLFTCGICPSGYACRNGKRSVCPAGTFSRQKASECQSCPPGTISRSEG